MYWDVDERQEEFNFVFISSFDPLLTSWTRSVVDVLFYDIPIFLPLTSHKQRHKNVQWSCQTLDKLFYFLILILSCVRYLLKVLLTLEALYLLLQSWMFGRLGNEISLNISAVIEETCACFILIIGISKNCIISEILVFRMCLILGVWSLKSYMEFRQYISW